LVVTGCTKDTRYEPLAKCLTEKGVVLYGGFACPHCLQQRQDFGSGIDFIKYVECDPRHKDYDKEACEAADIKAFPTWTFPGQEPVEGRVSLEFLAKKALCEDTLPTEDQ
jgi:hypothetical protein